MEVLTDSTFWVWEIHPNYVRVVCSNRSFLFWNSHPIWYSIQFLVEKYLYFWHCICIPYGCVGYLGTNALLYLHFAHRKFHWWYFQCDFFLVIPPRPDFLLLKREWNMHDYCRLLFDPIACALHVRNPVTLWTSMPSSYYSFVCVLVDISILLAKRDYANNLGMENSLSLRENNEYFI